MSYYSESELRELGLKDFGENVYIAKCASLYNISNISVACNSRIDDFCVISAGTGGVTIGSYVHIGVFCSLIGRGHIELHDFSGLAPRVAIYASSDDFTGRWMTNPTVPEAFTGVTHADVTIGRHAIIGAGSIVLPGAVLELGVAVGALSLVKGRCEEFGVYSGNPARRTGNRKRTLLKREAEFFSSISR